MGRLDEEAIAQLMRVAITGDREAYRRFFENITPMLDNMLRAMSPSLPSDLREDIVQETLTSIHAKRHTWRQDKAILPWIYAIARYRLIDFLRREKRSPTISIDLESGSFDDWAHPRKDTSALRNDLEQGIRNLNPQTEAVVRAMGVEGKGAKQIGAELGISENAARITFHRGLKKLRAFLSESYQER